MSTDLLLLNATNLPWRPIFPYAFVQVSAVARRNGLSVRVVDMLDVPQERWSGFLASHIHQHRPRMVGLHIRQSDSVFLDDYYAPPSGPQTTRSYFPIDDNLALVSVLRSLTSAPIIAGGVGFTTHAARLYQHLGIDFGVQGDPDDVFAHFEDVVASRDLDRIASLIYRRDGEVQVNARGYYAPFEGPEWTEDIFDQLVRFYGHHQLFGNNPPTVPIEIMRGCPFICYFCTEPYVKGSKIRIRPLDAVLADLEFLMARHIRRFWMVCSEIDLQGARYALQLAEDFIRLREKYGGLPVEWSAYTLPRLTEDELRVLQRSGYSGALNDVVSLDDENLRRARVPYRSKQAIAFLKAVTKLDQEEALSALNAVTAQEKVMNLSQRTPKELASVMGMFLGNAHATVETFYRSLRRVDDEGLRENYVHGFFMPSTRVFAPEGVPICETTERGMHTYGRTGERPIDTIHPTFYYPDFLIERLGGPDKIIEFMRYVGDTFLSIGHRAKKDWAWFLSNHTTLPELERILGDTARPSLRTLFSPSPADKQGANATTKQLLEELFVARPRDVAAVRAALGLPAEAISEYRLIESLYGRFGSRDEMLAALASPTAVQRLYLDFLIYTNNVVFKPEYAELLFGPRAAA